MYRFLFKWAVADWRMQFKNLSIDDAIAYWGIFLGERWFSIKCNFLEKWFEFRKEKQA